MALTSLGQMAVGVAAVGITMIPSFVLAERRDKRLRLANPGVKPYAWGYFCGYCGVIGGCLSLLANYVAMFVDVRNGVQYFVVGIAAAIFWTASVGVLRRRRWGWLLQIPMTLNPVLWVANGVYVARRWEEFGSPTKDTWWRSQSTQFRTWAFASTVWALAWLLISAIFDPWDMLEDEHWGQFLFLQVFPLLAWGTAATYQRWVK